MMFGYMALVSLCHFPVQVCVRVCVCAPWGSFSILRVVKHTW